MRGPMRLLEFERRQRGWSQDTLADLSGISRPTISLIESGRLLPTPAHAERLSAALGLVPHALLLTVDGCLLAEPTAEGTR